MGLSAFNRARALAAEAAAASSTEPTVQTTAEPTPVAASKEQPGGQFGQTTEPAQPKSKRGRSAKPVQE